MQLLQLFEKHIIVFMYWRFYFSAFSNKYPLAQFFFHKGFENVHHDMNVEWSINVVHCFGSNRINILQIMYKKGKILIH